MTPTGESILIKYTPFSYGPNNTVVAKKALGKKQGTTTYKFIS